MTFSFCPYCGSHLTPKAIENEGDIPFCDKCGQLFFPKYNVAVSMILRRAGTGEILLIKQYGRPFYILVAGYVNRGEKPEDAVVREAKEETGLTVTKVEFNRTQFFEPSDTLMCNFTAWTDKPDELHTNAEIDEWKWFTPADAIKNIKENSLAQHFLEAYLRDEDISAANKKRRN